MNADGGISANHFVVQLMANLLNKQVATIGMPDVSALGAASMAGLHAGIYPGIDGLKKINTQKKYYTPADAISSAHAYAGWQQQILQDFTRTV